MHFPLALEVILVCLTVACNGQFKIIGLLDTKSEINNGEVESIRSLDEVEEQFPQNKETGEVRVLSETMYGSESFDDNKENVNFIKPYEVVTNDLKRDFVEATSEDNVAKNNTSNVLVLDETDQNERIFGKEINSETNLDTDFAVTTPLSSTTLSTTIGAKAYRSECSLMIILGHFVTLLKNYKRKM